MKSIRIVRLKNIRRASERGSILALAAIGMTALLLSAAFCIDISHMYLVGTELQNAADAAALAGASSLNSTASGITKAVDRAINSVNRFEFNNDTATIGREDVRFAVNLSEFDSGGTGVSESSAATNPENIRFVRVAVPPKSMKLTFAVMVLGSNTLNMTRSAVAGQSAGLNVICNMGPFAVVEDPATGAPLNVNPECSDKTRFTPGCTYVCRLGPGGKSNLEGVSAGNYQILALENDRGGSDLRERLSIAAKGCFTSGQDVDTEPGVKGGPVRQGLNTRFDEYSGPVNPDDYPPDKNIKINITFKDYLSGETKYQQAPSHPGKPNRRVLILPIVKKDQFDTGRDRVHIDRFGAFFMKDKVDGGDGGDITVEYIAERFMIGDGGFISTGGTSNPSLTVAVLYR